MTLMQIDQDPFSFLSSLRADTESEYLINISYQLEDFYERKLWHQLTLALKEFYETEASRQEGLREKIYDNFVSQFSRKLNPIQVVDFLLASYQEDKEECLKKLLSLKNTFVDELKAEYHSRADNLEEVLDASEHLIYIDLQISRFQILLGNVKEADSTLDRLSPRFESTYENTYSAKLNGAYYLTKCQLCKVNEDYNQFYLNGLLYLSSVDNTKLPIEEQQRLCYDLCISAILGDRIYNFGELILHDILHSLENNEYDWLLNLVRTLNSGKLVDFESWLSVAFQRSPFLKKFEPFLREKVTIMSLLEIVSLRPTTNKQFSFKEISESTHTPLHKVELLIIKCFSLNLMKGQVNQLDAMLTVSWLQPRILDLNQVNVLYNHLCRWNTQLEQLSRDVHQSGGSLWASS